MSPIATALAPLQVAAIAAADKMARDYIRAIEARLAEHGGDLNSAFPWPNSLDDPKAAIKWQIICWMTGNNLHWSTADTYASEQCTAAINAFAAFTERLAERIGACTTATLSDNILATIDTAGTVHRWQIRQIINYSKTGVAFMQWPVRKVG